MAIGKISFPVSVTPLELLTLSIVTNKQSLRLQYTSRRIVIYKSILIVSLMRRSLYVQACRIPFLIAYWIQRCNHDLTIFYRSLHKCQLFKQHLETTLLEIVARPHFCVLLYLIELSRCVGDHLSFILPAEQHLLCNHGYSTPRTSTQIFRYAFQNVNEVRGLTG